MIPDRRAIVRALVMAAIVGSALVLINHGDHIAREPMCNGFCLKAALSYLTPFVVSLVTNAWVARERGERRADRLPSP